MRDAARLPNRTVHHSSRPAPDADVVRERVLLDEARAEFANGLQLDSTQVDAWLDALDGDSNVALPTSVGKRQR